MSFFGWTASPPDDGIGQLREIVLPFGYEVRVIEMPSFASSS